MIAALVVASLVLAGAIVAAVAYHLVGILLALKRAGDHLQALAGGLAAIRDDTAPLKAGIDAVNAALAALLPPLRGAAAGLAGIAAALGRG